MKFGLVALLAGFCAVNAVDVVRPNYAEYQKDIWELFKYINQPSYHKEHVEIAKTYHFWDHKDLYVKPGVVEHFQQYWKYETLLRKGEIFSVFYEEHLHQAVALFKLFYYAKDFDTLYKTAVWARQHLNEGLFLYSFSVALIHRPDTHYLVLPAIYEIYPHYFFNTETIHQAQYYKQMYNGKSDDYNRKTIHAKYSGHYLNLHPQQSMSYFLEDVGINAFYYHYNLYYPFWLDGDEFGVEYAHRGEVFFYINQQILARYYLENLSNGFGEIDNFDWDLPFPTGYYPSLTYPNGLEFPTRPHFAKLHEYFYNYGQKWTLKHKYGYSYTAVQDYERRIHDAVDSGYVYVHDEDKHEVKPVSIFSHEGFNVLGNLIEGNPGSPFYKFYGAYQIFARHLLGYSAQAVDHHKLHPSALEHFETSMRDPAFYMLYKKLITHFYRYKYQHVKAYTENDLFFNDVDIEKVEFDRLVTYCDYFYSDLSNAIYVTPEEYINDNFKVRAGQGRLNHRPFTYKIHVKANKPVKASVHVYMGPKYDEYGRHINLTENYMNFVQFDHFTYKLDAGQNTIVRDSRKIQNYMHDRNFSLEVTENVYSSYNKSFKFQFDAEQFGYGFPHRYMLPKGDYGGVAYQFYVIVSPYIEYKSQSGKYYVGSPGYVDGYPMGYPFDRPIYFPKIFHDMPNGYFYETKIHHKDYLRKMVLPSGRNK